MIAAIYARKPTEQSKKPRRGWYRQGERGS